MESLRPAWHYIVGGFKVNLHYRVRLCFQKTKIVTVMMTAVRRWVTPAALDAVPLAAVSQ